jgi:hypothetical protein
MKPPTVRTLRQVDMAAAEAPEHRPGGARNDTFDTAEPRRLQPLHPRASYASNLYEPCADPA